MALTLQQSAGYSWKEGEFRNGLGLPKDNSYNPEEEGYLRYNAITKIVEKYDGPVLGWGPIAGANNYPTELIFDSGQLTLKRNGLSDLSVLINADAIGLGLVENTALSTWAGSDNITNVGVITDGVWNGMAISPLKGGIPPGGTTGQVIKKLSDTDYDLDWADEGAGGGGGSTAWGAITGTLSDQLDLITALENKQPKDTDLTQIAGLTPVNDDIIQRKGGVWVNRTLTQYKTDLALNNVDNTSDINKPISTATQSALDLKQNTLESGVNIKTINGNSLLGSGNLVISGGTAYTFSDGVTESGGAVSIPTNGITTAKINALAVTDAKIASVAWPKISGTPTTVAGYGITDAVTLTGTQTITNKTINGLNNTISNIALTALLQGGATTGEVLKWNGSAWAPATDNISGGGTTYVFTGGLSETSGTVIIADGGVTDAKIASVSWSKITGTPTTVAGYGITDAVTLTGIQSLTNKTLIAPKINVGADAPGDTYYRDGAGNLVRLPIGTNGQVLKVVSGAPAWAADATGGGGGTTLADGDYGDVTVSAAGTAIFIDSGVVTNAKLANVATGIIKGRTTAGTGVVEDLTATQVTAMLNTFTSTLKGLTPASGGGTINFLRADGTWAAPTGSTYVFNPSDFNESGNTISIDYTNGQTANGSTKGFLSPPDWTTFNNKLSSIAGIANRISVAGNTIDISAAYTGQSSITTLGTILLGTWNGTAIGTAYGGVPTGGTTGQVLAKSSNSNYAYTWVTPSSATIYAFDGGLIEVGGTVSIATGGVTSTKIADLAVTDAKINSVGWSKITATPTTVAGYGITDAVTLTGTQTLTNKTLTAPKINVGSDATGDIYYRDGSGNYTRLGIGMNGQVLKVTGGLPAWGTDLTGGGGVSDGTYADIIISASGSVYTVANGAISNAKLANMPTQTIKGRTTAGTGVPEDLTATQVTAMLNGFTASLKGLVPASGGGTTTYLRADGTWATPPGTYVFTASDFNEVGNTISIDYINGQTANGSTKGFLSAASFNTFNNKQDAISVTTTGTSGPATFIGNVLNIPQYSSGTVYSGTTNRIFISGSSIDISTAYAGQTSINTLGTVTTGVWNGSPIGTSYGGVPAGGAVNYILAKTSGADYATAWVPAPTGGSDYLGTDNRISITGNVINISPNYVGQNTINTLGTVTTGTWQATPIAPSYGGIPTGGTAGQILAKTSNANYATQWIPAPTGATYYAGTGIVIDGENNISIAPGYGGVTDGDKGDITVSLSGATWSIDNNAITTSKILDGNVTNAKLANSSINFSTPGTTGTAPNWGATSTALGGSSLLNIPMASAAGVAAGLISKAQYDTVNYKATVYNVRQYGAKGDGIEREGAGAAGAGSTAFTSSISTFSPGDVGKIIQIDGAGVSGRSFVTTIAAYVSATAVTLASPVNTAVGSVRFVYGTDDTVAIQLAIDTCYAAGGGKVYIPNGFYFIGGALRTNVNGVNPNCQIFIPAAATSRDAGRTVISIEGETEPSHLPNNTFNAVDYFPAKKGTVLLSTATGSGVAPVIFGTLAPNTAYQNVNYSAASVKNISLLVTKNLTGAGATIGGFNFSKLMTINIDNVFYSIDGLCFNNPEPTGDVAGLITTVTNGEVNVVIRNSMFLGARYGVVMGEHTILDGVVAVNCYAGFVPSFNGHPSYATRIGSYWNKYDLYFPTTSILGLPTIGTSYFAIAQLNTECTSGTGNWWNYSATIYDPNNYGRGRVYYHIVQQNIGPNYSLYSKVGGSNILAYQVQGGSDATQWVNNGDDIYYAGGGAIVSPTATSTPHMLHIENNQGAPTFLYVKNSTSHADAQAGFRFDNGTALLQGGIYSPTTAPYGSIPAGASYEYSNAAAGHTIMADAGVIRLAANGNTAQVFLSVDEFSSSVPYTLRTGGSNRGVRLANGNLADNNAILRLYPESGTNVATALNVVPKGIGDGGLSTVLNLHNRDAVNDAANLEIFTLRTASTAFLINSISSGTGTLRPIKMQMQNVDKFILTAAGGIQTPGFTSGYIQVDASGNWSVGGGSGGGGGESLDQTLTIGNSTAQAINFTGSGSNRTISIGNPDVADNNAILRLYPVSGTNVTTALNMIPKGTGDGGLTGVINMYNKDAIADGSNLELFSLRTAGTSYLINSISTGTGTLRPIKMQMQNVDKFVLTSAGGIQTPGFVSGYLKVDNSGNWSVDAGTGGGGGGSQNLQQVTDIGASTTNGVTISNAGGVTAGLQIISSGASSYSSVTFKNNVNSTGQIFLTGSTYTPYSQIGPNNVGVYNSGGIALVADDATIKFAAGLNPAPFVAEMSSTGLRMGAGLYNNFGATAGSTGYGFRDNAGTMEFKNSGGSWTTFNAGGGGGTGTVTSVALSGGLTGLTVSGSPITTSGTITLGGTLGTSYGGTGLTAYNTGSLFYASGPNTFAQLAPGTSGYYLGANGVGVAPSWKPFPGAGQDAVYATFDTVTTNSTPTLMTGVMTVSNGEYGLMEVTVYNVNSFSNAGYSRKFIIPYRGTSTTSVVYLSQDDIKTPSVWGSLGFEDCDVEILSDSNGDTILRVTGIDGQSIQWRAEVKKYSVFWAA